MNILLVEDKGATAFYIKTWLEEEGHVVMDAFNPNDAQSHWANRNQVPIHCIILDLNISIDGLRKTQIIKSEGGLLSGWVWLYDNVLSKEPKMRQRTIIYSDYITILREKIPNADYRGISLVAKRQRSSSANDIISRIKEIARMTTF